MEKPLDRRTIWKLLIACAGVAVLAFAVHPISDAWAELPPRPSTPTPPTQPADSDSLSSVELRAEFPDDWPWLRLHWQRPWTVVQWQDAEGAWHDVEGWQGTFERVTIEGYQSVRGWKRWWFPQEHFGTGPFRWIVYDGRDRTERLAVSEPFSLPEHSGAVRRVSISIALPRTPDP